MDSKTFLADLDLRPLTLPDAGQLEPVGLMIGPGSAGLEVAVARSERKLTQDALRNAWKSRQGGRATPVLLVALHADRAALCGPAGETPPVFLDLDTGQVERICRTALAEPNRHAAARFLWSVLPEIKESQIPGLRNQGLFATHELEKGVPQRSDWTQARQKADCLLSKRGRELLAGLGFQVSDSNQQYAILRCGQTKMAVAVFLDRSEACDIASDRFGGMTPVQYALAKADDENLDYVLVDHGSSLRIHTAAGKGVGRRGRTETFVEIHLDLLPSDRAGYLWLLFSGVALSKDGSFSRILEESHDYASYLGARLRDRIYDFVVPDLAIALAKGRKLRRPTVDDLATTYEMALLVLFRLLFIAYAEDKDLLPYRTNERYRDRSLKKKARELAALRQQGTPVFGDSSSHWDEVTRLFRAVNTGKPREWGVPAYNGGMFSEDSAISVAGKLLANLCLPNKEFGPVLCNLLVDPTPEGFGPVDFRSLGVRDFGTIYEGLLESELSAAEEDLVTDADGVYIPAGKQPPKVRRGQVYLHSASGARKTTGSYYTKDFAVEHVLDYSLEPAISEHLVRLNELDDRRAADALFDFRVADIAMGSGHFLVAAVDRIERRFTGYLAKRPLPGVIDELRRLRQSAMEAIDQAGGSAEGIEIDNVQLLRRQIARRCIYGVDINKTAVQLARLSLWIHTFVPGLPLSFLDYNIVPGDSLVGIATFNEVDQVLKRGGPMPLFDHSADALIGSARAAVKRLGQLSDANAAEITQAREAYEEQKRAVAPRARMFDILTASRLPDSGLSVTTDDFDGTSELFVQGLHRVAEEVLGDLRPFHFPIEFPGVFLRDNAGFDVILGNPPWDKVRFESQQFWVARCPGLNSIPAAARDREIEELRRPRPHDAQREQREIDLRAKLQRAIDCAYNLHGRGHHGHHDLAKIFCERALRLLTNTGRLGLALPRVALVLGGWTDIRKEFVRSASMTVLQATNKGGWFFDDLHPQIKVCLLTRAPATSGKGRPGIRIWPAVTSRVELESATEKNSLYLSEQEIRTLTDHSVIPWFASPEDRCLFDRLRSFPRLGTRDSWITGIADSSRWDFSGSGPHKEFTKGRVANGAWRVLMTRHVEAYRIDTEPEFQRFVPSPRKLAALGLGVVVENDRAVLASDHPTIIYRYPSTSDNTRTMIATVLPEEGFIYSKGYVHGLRTGDAPPRSVLALLGYLNSFVCDWWVRRFADRHVTLPVLTNTPLPEWDEAAQEAVARLVSCLLVRSGTTRIPGGHELTAATELKNRSEAELLAQIETHVLEGFKLGSRELQTVLADFSENACSDTFRAILGQVIAVS